MKTYNTTYRHVAGIALATSLLLLIPLLAMQFTEEVDWNLTDFIVMGVLLFGTGLALDAAARKLTSPEYRVIAIAAIVITFLLIWAELAVGIFGTLFAGS